MISGPLVVVLALALLSCAGLNRIDPATTVAETGRARAPSPAPADALVIATYNVHMAKAPALLAALRGDPTLARADVILLQEIEAYGASTPSEAAWLATALGFHHAYAPGYGLRRGGSHGIAVLSRYPLTDVEIVELPRVWTVVNSARRVALGVTVHAGEPIRVWNVHLDNRINPADRVAQLSVALDAADRSSISRHVIAGDLNTSPFCWVGRLVPVPCGLQTRRVEAELERRGFLLASRKSGATSRYLGMRLDTIAVRGALSTGGVGVGETVLSDHAPLWARVTTKVSW